MSLTGKDVAEIARLLDQSRFSELKLEIGEFRLRIRREGAGGTLADEAGPAPQEAMPQAAPAPPRSSASAADEVDVPAPLLGTFYHAPRPGDPPFVEPGQAITADTTIGIIEVMKLMNPVRAGVAGTVTAVLAANADAVEAGQPLIRVRR
jgi:acetyl-CoA carboxylase biotin carboxyl carrier protein